MTTLTIDLPDNLAKQAKAAGLLKPGVIEALLRETLKQRSVDELFKAMERMEAVDHPPAMLPEEIAEEIRKLRIQRRSKNAP